MCNIVKTAYRTQSTSSLNELKCKNKKKKKRKKKKKKKERKRKKNAKEISKQYQIKIYRLKNEVKFTED